MAGNICNNHVQMVFITVKIIKIIAANLLCRNHLPADIKSIHFRNALGKKSLLNLPCKIKVSFNFILFSFGFIQPCIFNCYSRLVSRSRKQLYIFTGEL